MDFQYTTGTHAGRNGVRFAATITPLIQEAALEPPAHTVQVGDVDIQFSNLVTAEETTVVNPDGTVTKTREDGVLYFALNHWMLSMMEITGGCYSRSVCARDFNCLSIA